MSRFYSFGEPRKSDKDRRYIVLREQEGEGCDYTIGCGKTWSFIWHDPEAEPLEDRIYRDVLKNYGNEVEFCYRDLTEERPERCSVFEVSSTDFDWGVVMKRLKKAADFETEQSEKTADEEEFERLKKKLGK